MSNMIRMIARLDREEVEHYGAMVESGFRTHLRISSLLPKALKTH